MKPHKHAELIRAWADGAVIQYFNIPNREWRDVFGNQPRWFDDTEYRIKPEPKPDVVVKLLIGPTCAFFNASLQNLCLTFDGETHQLKDAEVIK